MSEKPQQPGIYGPNAGRRSAQERPNATTNSAPTPTSETNAYLRTKVMTASPAELRLMLIEGAIRFVEQARTGVVSQNHEQSYTGFSKARAIITELISGLNPDISPELCDRMTSLYTFVFTRLVEASSAKSVEIIDEVLELLRFERETWSMLVENLSHENASASSMKITPTATPPANTNDDSGTSMPGAIRISTTG